MGGLIDEAKDPMGGHTTCPREEEEAQLEGFHAVGVVSTKQF